jgi:hypothetical protein
MTEKEEKKPGTSMWNDAAIPSGQTITDEVPDLCGSLFLEYNAYHRRCT